MDVMYSADVNSTNTELSSGISDTATTIGVVDASVLPPAPNIAVIGYDTDNAETIKYTGLDETNNNITGVTRGFQGTATQWGVETKVARTFTAYDHDTFKSNIEELDTSKVEQSDFDSHSGNSSSHHDRYTDNEAVSAVSSADDYVRNTGDTMTGAITTPNGAMGIHLGDDSSIGDVNESNMVGLQGQQNPTNGGIIFGSDLDTNIYRGGANELKTDDQMNAVSGYKTGNFEIVYNSSSDSLDFNYIA
jgi:hypothetical protein